MYFIHDFISRKRNSSNKYVIFLSYIQFPSIMSIIRCVGIKIKETQLSLSSSNFLRSKHHHPFPLTFDENLRKYKFHPKKISRHDHLTTICFTIFFHSEKILKEEHIKKCTQDVCECIFGSLCTHFGKVHWILSNKNITTTTTTQHIRIAFNKLYWGKSEKKEEKNHF